jgi:isocitrate lyase
MMKDMAEYDANASNSHNHQVHMVLLRKKNITLLKNIKQLVKKLYIFIRLDGCCVTPEFGPQPDQSMHVKTTTVPALIKEIYDFLRQADAIELNDLFRRLENGEEVQDQIDNF